MSRQHDEIFNTIAKYQVIIANSAHESGKPTQFHKICSMFGRVFAWVILILSDIVICSRVILPNLQGEQCISNKLNIPFGKVVGHTVYSLTVCRLVHRSSRRRTAFLCLGGIDRTRCWSPTRCILAGLSDPVLLHRFLEIKPKVKILVEEPNIQGLIVKELREIYKCYIT
ncbi:hypothetical protein GJV44_p00040 (plasmid) [Candidatus Vallotia cooleyia]|nr:hypothetical protein GJV44_p00040 [Candidatus Vallotia cooleyia]